MSIREETFVLDKDTQSLAEERAASICASRDNWADATKWECFDDVRGWFVLMPRRLFSDPGFHSESSPREQYPQWYGTVTCTKRRAGEWNSISAHCCQLCSYLLNGLCDQRPRFSVADCLLRSTDRISSIRNATHTSHSTLGRSTTLYNSWRK